MTAEKIQGLASYIRQNLHKNASSDFRYNHATTSWEIDVVHPSYGQRVVAFSDELLDDNDLEYIKQLVDQCGVVRDLGGAVYQPVVFTNQGVRPYEA